MIVSIRYTYETKCRRCGIITEWFFADSTQLRFKNFIIAMDDYIQLPRSKNCKICEKDTIQDVVAYSPICVETNELV